MCWSADGVIADRALVERREVPDVEVRRPQHERDDRVAEDPQPRDRPQERREHRTRQPEHDQQRAEVRDQQVPSMCAQNSSSDIPARRRASCHQDEAAVEAPLAPGGRARQLPVAQPGRGRRRPASAAGQWCELDPHPTDTVARHVQPFEDALPRRPRRQPAPPGGAAPSARGTSPASSRPTMRGGGRRHPRGGEPPGGGRLRSATDGEFRRASWHMDFIYRLGGVTKPRDRPARAVLEFPNARGRHRVYDRHQRARRTGRSAPGARSSATHFAFLRDNVDERPRRSSRSRRQAWSSTAVGGRQIEESRLPGHGGVLGGPDGRLRSNT